MKLRDGMLLIFLVALNLWLFRFGWMIGFIAANVFKHLAIAYFCRRIGVDREDSQVGERILSPPP